MVIPAPSGRAITDTETQIVNILCSQSVRAIEDPVVNAAELERRQKARATAH